MVSIASVRRVLASPISRKLFFSVSRLFNLHCAHFNSIRAKYIDGFDHLPDLITPVSITDFHFGIARGQLPHRIGHRPDRRTIDRDTRK